MSTTTCQVVGFLLSILGLAGCIAATGMDMWSTQDLYDSPVTSVFQYEGLWRSCVRQSSGFTECRPFFTILGLPGRRWAGPPGPHQGRAGRDCELPLQPGESWEQVWLRIECVTRRSWPQVREGNLIGRKIREFILVKGTGREGAGHKKDGSDVRACA